MAGVRELLDKRPDLIVREYTNAEVLIEEDALSQSEAEQASEQKALIANSEVALSAAPPAGSMSGRLLAESNSDSESV